MTLVLVCLAAPSAAGALEARLTESEARQIALDAGDISAVVDEHPELDGYVNYIAASGTWEVTWRNPFNSRQLVIVKVDDASGRIESRYIDPEARMDILPSLSEEAAIEIAREQEKVAEALSGVEGPDPAASLENGEWKVSFFDEGGEAARVLIDDITGDVNEIMIGPQVAWSMARGYKGAFGRIVNEPYIWLPLCLLFLLPFVDLRRPGRLFHLDLLVLLSFTISHYFFNQGDISTSVPLTYPPLVWLFLRLTWIWLRPSDADLDCGGTRRGGDGGLHLNFSPRVMLIGLVVLLVARIVMNVADSNVVDVGYSGVIGGHHILEGETPYGHMPDDNSNGDTYGPFNYLVYVPFVKVFPWSGEWDNLYAAHAAAIFFDLVAVAGMYAAGRRFTAGEDGRRLGLALAFAWTAYPYTTFVQNCNVNDSIVAAFIIWAFVFLASAPLAGVLLGFAVQIKFFPAIIGPLWASFPHALRGWGRRALFIAACAAAVAVTLPIIFMGDGSMTRFWENTLKWQLERESPFSIWGQHPDRLESLQHIAQYFLVGFALVAYFLPLRKTFFRVAAAGAALLVGFQLVQSHWFYLYITWFFPLAFIALYLDSSRRRIAHGEVTDV